MGTRLEGLFSRARATIGNQRTLTIGDGPAVAVIEATANADRSFDELVARDETETVVSIPRSTWDEAYPGGFSQRLGEQATLDSDTFRVDSLRPGRNVMHIRLIDREQGA